MRFGFGSLELKLGPCYTNGGGDLERTWKLCGEGLLNQNMVRMGEVGFLVVSLGIACQICGVKFF